MLRYRITKDRAPQVLNPGIIVTVNFKLNSKCQKARGEFWQLKKTVVFGTLRVLPPPSRHLSDRVVSMNKDSIRRVV